MLAIRKQARCAALLALTGLTIHYPAMADSKRGPFTVSAADPSLQGDGTMGPAARAAKLHGALPMCPVTAILKAAADREHAEAVKSGKIHYGNANESLRGPRAPAVVGGHNFAGIPADTPNTFSTPPDNEGAIGKTRYVQTINSAVSIFNRTTHTVIANGSLNELANNAASVNSFDPQIIWDPTTNRFYYAMDSIFSASDNRLAFGFSTTASPSNLTTDWCHYTFSYGVPFPDYPKLGDSRYFMLIGVNVFANNSSGGFVGSDIVAISKPAAGTACPAFGSFKTGVNVDIRDSGNSRVFTPVPSNQIDNNSTGYVVTIDGHLPPVDKLWFFNVTRGGTGNPVFGTGRSVTVVPAYDIPPNVTQANGMLLDSSDTRNTQAVQAINPLRGTVQSFWTQHTVKDGLFSAVRFYEINPAPATPVVLRSGLVKTANAFAFNGAISPDRKKNGTTVAFGNSFVIQYNSASPTLSARISARSSFNGGGVSAPVLIKRGVGPYLDFFCPNVGNVCRWGDYAAATPDPAPTIAGRGVVWSTNQFSGVVSPPTSDFNWRTQIFALQP